MTSPPIMLPAFVVVGLLAGWNVPADAVALARATANEPPLEHVDHTVRLHVPDDSRTRRAVTIAYEVLVPTGIQVTARSESGETRVENIRGVVSVRTQSAAIRLTDLGETRVHTAEFRANAAFILDATSGSGSVETENLVVLGHADNRLVTGSVDVGGPTVDLSSRSGSIRLPSIGSHDR